MAARSPVTATIGWFTAHGRDLPWRDPSCSPWGVLVSEVMLQQTQVDRVLPRWQAWMERWPMPSTLASSAVADALRMWDRLGYPRRARWLWQTADIIRTTYADEVPDDEVALRALPGVGPYTAAAVRAFAFQRRAIALDTNVRRVLARHFEGIARPPAAPTAAERALAEAIWPMDDRQAARWTAAVMELGALVCTARDPRCTACPMARTCAWRAAGYPESPTPARRQAPYAGSIRQLRGAILDRLRSGPARLTDLMPFDTERVPNTIEGLLVDRLITKDGDRYRLGD